MERFIRRTLGLSGYSFELKVTPSKRAGAHGCFLNCERVDQAKFIPTACWYVDTQLTLQAAVTKAGLDLVVPKGAFEATLHCVLKRAMQRLHLYRLNAAPSDGRFFDITPEPGARATTRTIVLEPRASAKALTKILKGGRLIENMASPTWEKFVPADPSYLNFFEVLEHI